jgi:hypothetical protein
MATKVIPSTTKANKTLAHAQYADKAIPPLMQECCAWLATETGVHVDARSVYLGSALREKFQKERRAANDALLKSIKVTPKPKRRPAAKADA